MRGTGGGVLLQGPVVRKRHTVMVGDTTMTGGTAWLLEVWQTSQSPDNLGQGNFEGPRGIWRAKPWNSPRLSGEDTGFSPPDVQIPTTLREVRMSGFGTARGENYSRVRLSGAGNFEGWGIFGRESKVRQVCGALNPGGGVRVWGEESGFFPQQSRGMGEEVAVVKLFGRDGETIDSLKKKKKKRT